MAQLFSVGKIGVLLDSAKWGIEKRRGEEVKVLLLTCIVKPFDAKLAVALDEGVGGHSNIRATVFNLNDAKPRLNFTGHDFTLGLPRQDFELFATPDSPKARLALTHVKINGAINVKIHKDNPNALTMTFKGAVGPVSKSELEFIGEWFRGQKFINFSESEASLEFSETDETDDDDEPEEAVKGPRLIPPPEFNTTPSGEIIDAESGPRDTAADQEPVRPISRRHKDPKTAAAAKQRGGRRS